jgi:rubrerythrin
MYDNSLKEILILCKAIEISVAQLYKKFSERTEIVEQKIFWEELAQDEKHHTDYWEKLLQLEKKINLYNPFEHPANTIAQLQSEEVKIREMLNGEDKLSDFSSMFFFAMQMEFIMLHPSYCILFRILRDEISNVSIEDDYYSHLRKFSHFVQRYQNNTEIAYLAELLLVTWKRNLEFVDNVDKIKLLKGIITVCASCDKARDKEGSWRKREQIILEQFEVKFSHGLCPGCFKQKIEEIDKLLQLR